MALKTQEERAEEARTMLVDHLLHRWTIEELFAIEARSPGRIASLLGLIGNALADFLYEATPLMHAEPDKWLYRLLPLIADMSSFYEACIRDEHDESKRMMIAGARNVSMGLVRWYNHIISARARWARFEERFKAHEQEFRDCLADDPDQIDMTRLLNLTGYAGEYNPDWHYPEFDLFLAWMHNEGIIDQTTYLHLC